MAPNNDPDRIFEKLHSVQEEHMVISDYMSEFDQVLYSIEENMTEEQIRITERFLDFVESHLLVHFENEEKNFFPTINNMTFKDQEMAKMMMKQLLEEHSLIRNMYNRVRAQFGKIDSETSLDWFIASAMSLLDFIRTHARKENAIILFLTQGLSEDELQQHVYQSYTQVHSDAREYV